MLLVGTGSKMCRVLLSAELLSLCAHGRCILSLHTRQAGFLLACLGHAQPVVAGLSTCIEVNTCCAELGFQMDLLDIGGGFCSGAGFAGGVTAAVNSALAEHFPASLGAQIIAEPGRWGLCCIDVPLTSQTCTLNKDQQLASICLASSAMRVSTRPTRAYIRK